MLQVREARAYDILKVRSGKRNNCGHLMTAEKLKTFL